MNYNIAIDGPAGAGKSTIAKIIADKIKMTYIDTGAVYRAITLLAHKFCKNNVSDIINLARKADIKIYNGFIYINGEDVTSDIRSLEVSNKVSKIAKIPEIRNLITDFLQEMAKKNGIVMDGRDIGTTVIPDAKYKFYITADVNERALRRYNELKDDGKNVSYEQIKKDIITRDHQDKSRDYSPLAIADDAIIIETTKKSVNQVVEEILQFLKMGEDDVL